MGFPKWGDKWLPATEDREQWQPIEGIANIFQGPRDLDPNQLAYCSSFFSESWHHQAETEWWCKSSRRFGHPFSGHSKVHAQGSGPLHTSYGLRRRWKGTWSGNSCFELPLHRWAVFCKETFSLLLEKTIHVSLQIATGMTLVEFFHVFIVWGWIKTTAWLPGMNISNPLRICSRSYMTYGGFDLPIPTIAQNMRCRKQRFDVPLPKLASVAAPAIKAGSKPGAQLRLQLHR